MNDIDNTIKSFLAQDELDYEEAVRIYAQHPKANARQTQRYYKRMIAAHMHTHVVYMLEMFAGLSETGRKSIYGLNSVVKKNIPELLTSTQERVELELEADNAFSKKIEDLTPEDMALVLRKRDLNNKLDQYRKELFAMGEGNKPELVAKRKTLIANIASFNDEIKAIWAKLEIDPKELISEKDEEKESVDADNEDFSPEYYKKKDQLKLAKDKLRKQQEAAVENKTEQGRKNASDKAENTKKEVEGLELWFKDNGF